jgi:hypothetical protein
MRISRSLAPLALALALFASPSFAQGDQAPGGRPDSPAPRPEAPAQQAPPPGGQAQVATAQGELVDVDAKASTLTIKTAANEMRFQYNEQTKVTGGQKGVAGLATMTGSQVVVQYRKDGANNIATSIEVKQDRK